MAGRGTSNVFRSRLARRVVLLFFASALLPVALIGALSFRQVITNLREQNHRRIHQQAKATAMGIVERLLLLEADLDLAASQLRFEHSADAPLPPGLSAQLQSYFEGVALSAQDGHVEAILTGEIEASAPLTRAEIEHLDANHTLIRVRPSDGLMAKVLLARRVEPSSADNGVVWGLVKGDFLWGVGPKNPLPPSVELCVVDEDGRMLIRSLAIPEDFALTLAEAAGHSIDRRFGWSSDGRTFLAGYWPISMRTNYQTPAWTVVISEDRRLALQPVADFQATFPLVLLLSLWIVLLFSLIQIRRSLGPLQDLREATSRIADGAFDTRVAITSGDEFEELGDTLNWMAGRLGTQFRSLSAHATVGSSALTGTPIAELAQTIIDVVLDAYPSATVGLAVVDERSPDRALSSVGRRLGKGAGSGTCISDATVDMTALPDIVELRAGSAVVRSGSSAAAAAVAPFLVGDTSARVGAVHLIPLVADRTLLGTFFLAVHDPDELSAECRQFGSDLAGQLALAIHGSKLRDALEAERRRLSRLVEHLPDGILLIDSEHRIVLANLVARRLLPVLTSASVGDPIERIGNYGIADLIPAGPGPRQEIVVDHPQRRVFTVATGDVGPSTDAPSTVIVVREVTREREIEDQMQRQDRLAAVGRLAAGIAHDFNNILQGIVMAGEVIARSDALPDPLRRMARDITLEGHRGALLIRQILDFSRTSPSVRESVDLGALVRELTRLLRRTIPENIAITVEIGEEPHYVLADVSKLQQVITNIVVNARDAMPGGGSIVLRLSNLDTADERTSPVPDLPAGRWVRLDVVDTGVGVPENVRPHIFEPFFTTKPSGQGTGLGLAQAFGIVDDHGGVVRFTSAEGLGTTFTVVLPRSEQGERPAVPTIEEIVASVQGRILVVEDNLTVLRGLQEALVGLRVPRHDRQQRPRGARDVDRRPSRHRPGADRCGHARNGRHRAVSLSARQAARPADRADERVRPRARWC